MRIIGGDARGRTIVAPAGAKTRPTQDYVRESLFNIIRWDVEDARVLDLFAGTARCRWRRSAGAQEALCWWIWTGRAGRGHPQKHGNFAS